MDDRLEAGYRGAKAIPERRSQDGGKQMVQLGAISPRKLKSRKIEALKEQAIEEPRNSMAKRISFQNHVDETTPHLCIVILCR